ncbi:MAG: hypothetical protein AAF487_06285 [Bacteroidota bacterium]
MKISDLRIFNVLVACCSWSFLLVELNYQRTGDSFWKGIPDLLQIDLADFGYWDLPWLFLVIILLSGFISTLFIFKKKTIPSFCLLILILIIWVFLSVLVKRSYFIDISSYCTSSFPFLLLAAVSFIVYFKKN